MRSDTRAKSVWPARICFAFCFQSVLPLTTKVRGAGIAPSNLPAPPIRLVIGRLSGNRGYQMGQYRKQKNRLDSAEFRRRRTPEFNTICKSRTPRGVEGGVLCAKLEPVVRVPSLAPIASRRRPCRRRCPKRLAPTFRPRDGAYTPPPSRGRGSPACRRTIARR